MLKNAITLTTALNAIVFYLFSAVADHYGYSGISTVTSNVALIMLVAFVLIAIGSTVVDWIWYFSGHERRSRA